MKEFILMFFMISPTVISFYLMYLMVKIEQKLKQICNIFNIKMK